LSGLSIMSVHREKISKDKQGFVDRFGRYPRRLQLLFLSDADKSYYNSGSQTVVREGFSGGTRAAFLSYSKSSVNSFLSYNSFVCYANVANSLVYYINLKYIWANYALLKPGVYTPILKRHQVVRDHNKFENHCTRRSGSQGEGNRAIALPTKFSKTCSVVRYTQGCSGVGTAFPHLFALTRTASQKSTVNQEDPVWKFLLANPHFIRTIWCSLPFYLVWERRSHQRRNEGAIPRAPNDCGGHRKVTTMSQALSSTAHLLQKNSGSNMDVPSLFLAPGA